MKNNQGNMPDDCGECPKCGPYMTYCDCSLKDPDMTDAMPERIWLLQNEGDNAEHLWCDHVPNDEMQATQYLRADLVRGNVDVEALKRVLINGMTEANEKFDHVDVLSLFNYAADLAIDHLAANGWLNAGWQTIDKHTGHKAVIIGRWNGHAWEYVHYAYFQNDLWFLPFDSERDKHGTPTLNGDELPTHFQPVWYSPEAP